MTATRTRRAPATQREALPAGGPQAASHRIVPSDPVMRLVHRAPVIVYLDTSLQACALLMAEESIGSVLVSGPHGPLGVLSERDVVAAVAEGEDLDTNRARDYMTADVDSLPETATIADAAREMLSNEIRHVVVSRGERAVGVVSIRDVLAVMGGE